MTATCQLSLFAATHPPQSVKAPHRPRKPPKCQHCSHTDIRLIDGRYCCWKCGEVQHPAGAVLAGPMNERRK